MRASFMLLGPLLARFGRVIISNPGGDRIGRRPVDLHVDAMRALGADDRLPQRLLLRPAPGRLRGGEVRVPVRVRHGHRERDARGDPGRGPHRHPAGGPGARGGRPHRVPQQDGRRGRADLPRTRSRSRVASACAARSTASIPDRIEAGTFVVAAAVTGGQVTLQGAPCDHLGAPSSRSLGRVGRRRRLRHGHDRGRRRRPWHRRLPRGRHRDRAVPGPRDGPPAADLRPADPGERHVARPRGDLRGPPRVAGRAAPDGRRDRHRRRAPRRRSTARRGSTAPTSRSATCGPARR